MQLVTTTQQIAAKKHTSAATRLAWLLWGISLVLAALGILLVFLNAHSDVDIFDYWVESTLSA